MQTQSPFASIWKLSIMFLALTVFGLAGCSDEDPANTTQISCTNDDPCPIGQVCLRAKGSCGVVSCEFCLPGQICYKNAKNEESCSRPECYSNDECTTAGTSCIDGLCQESTCNSKADCPDGKICNLASQCVEPPEKCGNDNECPSGEVCLDSGVCSAGCANDTECPDTQYCEPTNRICADGCRDSASCTAEQTCGADNKCTCDDGKCPEGKSCDPATNACAEGVITSCDEVTCQPGFYCNDQNGFACEAGCVAEPNQPSSCQVGEVCNTATGQCIADACPGQDPNQCAGTASPIWNPERCFCAECLSASDCPNAGDTCNSNGQCTSCETACDSSQAGTCQGATPYCVSGCCRACITAADCSNASDLCIEGVCGEAPDCSVDPTVCPAGWMCDANGECQSPSGGSSCDPQNPASCPSGQFCNSTDGSSGTCQSLGGGGSGDCGLCQAGCTCPGNMTCDGFMCSGCTGAFDTDCLGMGGICLSGLCLAFGL